MPEQVLASAQQRRDIKCRARSLEEHRLSQQKKVSEGKEEQRALAQAALRQAHAMGREADMQQRLAASRAQLEAALRSCYHTPLVSHRSTASSPPQGAEKVEGGAVGAEKDRLRNDAAQGVDSVSEPQGTSWDAVAAAEAAVMGMLVGDALAVAGDGMLNARLLLDVYGMVRSHTQRRLCTGCVVKPSLFYHGVMIESYTCCEMMESHIQVDAPVEHRLRGEAAGHDCGGVPCLASLPSLGLPAWPGSPISPISVFSYFRMFLLCFMWRVSYFPISMCCAVFLVKGIATHQHLSP